MIAPCHGMTRLFFSSLPKDVRAAKRLCAGCPESESCLEFATRSGETHGVWGGVKLVDIPEPDVVRSRKQPVKHGTSSGYAACRRENGEAWNRAHKSKAA